jgi:uncharacterized protein YceK
MVGRATFVVGAALAAATAGCGTLDNIKRPAVAPPSNPNAPVCRVYGGVTGEFKVIASFPKESIATPLDYVIIPVLATIDLALTVVGDTVTLPYTIGVEVRRAVRPSSGTPPPPPEATNAPVPPPVTSNAAPAAK